MNDTEYEWRQGLKVGDEVVVHHHGQPPSLYKITRASNLQVDAGYHAFNRANGKMRGGNSIGASWLKFPTAVLIEKANRARMIRRLGSVNWDGLPTEQLQAAYDAVTGGQHGTE